MPPIHSPPISQNPNNPTEPNVPLLPQLRLQCNNLLHPSSHLFFTSFQPSIDFPHLYKSVYNALYPPEHAGSNSKLVPSVRSITLVLNDLPGGVAHTTSLDLDPPHHKEIHLSLSYLSKFLSPSPSPSARPEILGIISHELVHTLQFDGQGTAPGGLIEGFADLIRMGMGLGAEHWREFESEDEQEEEVGEGEEDEWAVGYEKTAFFLRWIGEHKYRGRGGGGGSGGDNQEGQTYTVETSKLPHATDRSSTADESSKTSQVPVHSPLSTSTTTSPPPKPTQILYPHSHSTPSSRHPPPLLPHSHSHPISSHFTRHLNSLLHKPYEEEAFWSELIAGEAGEEGEREKVDVGELWKEYKRDLRKIKNDRG